MTRTFSLAGLLRLRKIREDQAAGDLAVANGDLRTTRAQSSQVRDELGETRTAVTNTAALNAVHTARASARSMLGELDALLALRQATADEAAVEFAAARSQSVRIEKLEARHSAIEVEADLRQEQGVLDEIASRSWYSTKSEATV